MSDKTAEGKEKTPAASAAASYIPLKSNTRVFFRYSRTTEKDFSDDDTVQLAAASEYPVERRADEMDEKIGIAKKGEKFLEVLSHRKEDVNLDRLNDNAALLDEHKDNRHLGSIQKAALSDDAITRVVAKFDNASKLSKTRKKQVRSGSRPHVSMGYRWTAYLGTAALPDGRTAHRFAWEGLEVSSVAVPADPTVGKGRSADEECRCIRCGGLFNRSALNDEYTCQDCNAAEEPAEETAEAERKATEIKNRKADKTADFKFKLNRDAADEISFSELSQMVSQAADSDKRFKTKRDNGDIYSAFFVQDIISDPDAGDWFAIIFNYADSTYWKVAFEIEGDSVMLGDASEVKWVGIYEPVTRSAVDSKKFTEAEIRKHNISQNKIMAKTIAELKTEAPELVAQLENETRTATAKSTRVEVLGEVEQRSKKREPLVKEIRALADEFVKTHGTKWAGNPGEVVVVGERIRAFAQKSLDSTSDESRSDSEIRSDFKNECNELVRNSRAAKNPLEAATLPQEIASRCSLGNILRAAMREDKWVGDGHFMPSEGTAEHEADKEMRKQAREFPGGQILGSGIQLPINIPTGIRSGTKMPRLGRDAAAGDFATGGAFIAPEYIFPFIELLRNVPALSRAGMTILSGLQGGRLVLPRQEAATTAQWVAEGAALTAYDQVLGQIALDPHRVGSTQNYSRLALVQSTPDFEAMVMADHMAQIALAIDEAGVNGTGSASQPLGFLNYDGIGSVTFGGSAANAFKNAIAMETAVRKANIFEEGTYLTTSTGRGMLKSTAKLLVGATTVAALPVWGDDEKVAGRNAVDSQQIPGDVLIYLVGRHLVMAQWGGLSVTLDTITKADKDQYKLSINTYIDFGLRHAQAVCRSSDSIAVLS